MKCVLLMIMLMVDSIVITVQIPYIFIAGAILMYNYDRNKYDKKVCVWIPTIGIMQYQYAEDGALHKKKIKYKELFH